MDEVERILREPDPIPGHLLPNGLMPRVATLVAEKNAEIERLQKHLKNAFDLSRMRRWPLVQAELELAMGKTADDVFQDASRVVNHGAIDPDCPFCDGKGCEYPGTNVPINCHPRDTSVCSEEKAK